MAVTANQLLQALTDAGINDQATTTRLFRVLLQQAFLIRQNQLVMKQVAGNTLTPAEKTEMVSNETALANLALQLG